MKKFLKEVLTILIIFLVMMLMAWCFLQVQP
jgi:hypothetical protein